MTDRLSAICPTIEPGNDQIALYENGRILTYADLARGVANLAANIRKTGVAPGSRIGICFDNTSAFVYGYMAILAERCIPVLLSPGLPAEKLSLILEDSGAAGVLGEIRAVRRLAACPPRVRFVFADGMTSLPVPHYSLAEGIRSRAMNVGHHPARDAERMPANVGEIASLIYTSGTTGRPKGVMLSEGNLLLATSAIIHRLRLSPADTCLVTMSFAHCAGLLHLLAHLRAGAKLVTGETMTLIGSVLAAIERHKVTVLPGVPSFFSLLSKHVPEKTRCYLATVRAIETSSSMINGSLIDAIAQLNPTGALFNTFGLTEAPRATYMEIDPANPMTRLSVGRPTAGVKVHIADQHLQCCPPHEAGEIVINGPNLALGYWNNPEKTAAKFTSLGYRTGDVGYMDENGLLYLKGRADDMIKVGAESVYPSEIEEVIKSFPGVEDALCYGIEDELYGMIIHADVVCNKVAVKTKELAEYCRRRLEKHKLPSRMNVCDSIALEESGKPKRGRAGV